MQCPQCGRADAMRRECTEVNTVTHYLNAAGGVLKTTYHDGGQYAGITTYVCEHAGCWARWSQDEPLRIMRQEPAPPPGAGMSPAAYAERRGVICPACGGGDLTAAQGLELDAGEGGQAVMCLACEATWTDVYRLMGYADFEPGKKGSDA